MVVYGAAVFAICLVLSYLVFVPLLIATGVIDPVTQQEITTKPEPAEKVVPYGPMTKNDLQQHLLDQVADKFNPPGETIDPYAYATPEDIQEATDRFNEYKNPSPEVSLEDIKEEITPDFKTALEMGYGIPYGVAYPPNQEVINRYVSALVNRGKNIEERTLGNITFRLFPGENDSYESKEHGRYHYDLLGFLEVSYKGKRVYFETDWLFEFYDTCSKCLSQVDHDITGDQIPEVVVKSLSGGLHCCQTLRIFSLTKPLLLLLHFDFKDAAPSVKDLNKDGIFEIISTDINFGYFHTSWNSANYELEWARAGITWTKFPRVILQFDQSSQRYQLAKELMAIKYPKVNERKLRSTAKKVLDVFEIYNQEFADDKWIGTEYQWILAGAALPLIYGGHGNQAYKLFDLFFEEAGFSKDEKYVFLKEFNENLFHSRYYPGFDDSKTEEYRKFLELASTN